MRLYNSLTQSVEEFTPQDDAVKIYVCGITPYDTTHLGHAATYCAFDILIRYLEYQGRRVVYVQNVTDIDDDTIREAKKRGTTWDALGNLWTAHFINDLTALNVRPPDYYPRATETIPEIINAVQTLVANGCAYERNGNVYFHIDAYPAFGQLSHIPTKQEMLKIANERGNFPDDPNKQDPLDFILWQAQQPEEPAWESPWGKGRPGWHIECSAMVMKLLGPTIDIHGGGADLIFPHHECEIAQAVNVTGDKIFSRFWMHAAMVRYQGEKMSKSLGNLVMVRDLLKEFPANALRLYLARHYYREAWEFTDEEFRALVARCQQLNRAARIPSGSRRKFSADDSRNRFTRSLDNDLDTPGAVEALCELASELLRGVEEGYDIREGQKTLRELASILGLRLDSAEPEDRVKRGWGEHLKRFEVAQIG